ncbi:hypothetical protein ABIE87_006497 [Bradyrhizobium diazoefficiens]
MKSTQAMRDRIRELMTDPIDDYDRAVLCVLNELEHMLNEPQTFGNAVLETTSNMAAAVENLARHQEQCDMDGVMVKVSRQALDEVLSGVEAINSFACAVSRPVLLRDEEAGK